MRDIPEKEMHVKDFAKDLGERVRKAREKAGHTQKQLAEFLGVTQPTYSQYEASLRLPSLEVFARMVEVLGVSADYLLGGIDREEIRLDDETMKLFAEFKRLNQRDRQFYIELLKLVKRHSQIQDC